jgi:hypothetical protein
MHLLANTVSLDLLPKAVKKLVTFAQLISPLNSIPHGLKRFRAPLFATDYRQRPQTQTFLDNKKIPQTQF